MEISPAQKTYYDELFRLADADNDGVIGVKDAGFFRKSGLADAVLGEVSVVLICLHQLCIV